MYIFLYDFFFLSTNFSFCTFKRFEFCIAQIKFYISKLEMKYTVKKQYIQKSVFK